MTENSDDISKRLKRGIFRPGLQSTGNLGGVFYVTPGIPPKVDEQTASTLIRTDVRSLSAVTSASTVLARSVLLNPTDPSANTVIENGRVSQTVPLHRTTELGRPIYEPSQAMALVAAQISATQSIVTDNIANLRLETKKWNDWTLAAGLVAAGAIILGGVLVFSGNVASGIFLEVAGALSTEITRRFFKKEKEVYGRLESVVHDQSATKRSLIAISAIDLVTDEVAANKLRYEAILSLLPK